MAKKGQTFKKYSPEFKLSVILDMREHKLSYQISFVYKMGIKDFGNVKKNRVPRKVRVNRETGEQEFVCNSTSDGFGTLCCDSPDARLDSNSTMSEISRKYTEILYFPIVFPHFVFMEDADGYKQKVLKKHATVHIVVNLVTGNTRTKN
jgi:hypothetical protein